jgi:hypothetical protein
MRVYIIHNTRHGRQTHSNQRHFNISIVFPTQFSKELSQNISRSAIQKTSRMTIIIESIQFLQVGRWRFKVNQINQINIFFLLRVCNDGKLKIISKKRKHDNVCVRLRWISAMLHVVRRSIKIRKCLTTKKDNGHTLSTWKFSVFCLVPPEKNDDVSLKEICMEKRCNFFQPEGSYRPSYCFLSLFNNG